MRDQDQADSALPKSTDPVTDARLTNIEKGLNRVISALGLDYAQEDYALVGGSLLGGSIGCAANQKSAVNQTSAPDRELTYLEEHLQQLDYIGSTLTAVLHRMGIQSDRTFGSLPQDGSGGQAAKAPESILSRLDIACEWLSGLVDRIDTEQRKLDRVI